MPFRFGGGWDSSRAGQFSSSFVAPIRGMRRPQAAIESAHPDARAVPQLDEIARVAAARDRELEGDVVAHERDDLELESLAVGWTLLRLRSREPLEVAERSLHSPRRHGAALVARRDPARAALAQAHRAHMGG